MHQLWYLVLISGFEIGIVSQYELAAEITGCLSQLSLLTTSTSHPYINRKYKSV